MWRPAAQVEFPSVTTTRFGGHAWISAIKNEETLNFAARHTGGVLMPRIEVEVVGINLGRHARLPHTDRQRHWAPGARRLL